MRLERATRTFLDGEVVAFQDLDLEIRPNESLCVVGPSGCGKTTLLRCLAGLIQPTEGNVYLDGQPVKKPSPNVVMVFQHFGLFPWKTVFDNVAYGLKLRGTPKAKWAELVRPHLELVGLGACEDLYPYQLSGGMQQRAGLARALVLNPEVLLMDEPFGSLDAQTRELLQDELLRIWQRVPRTMVFITHSIEEAIALGDRVVVLSPRPASVRDVVQVDIPRPRTVEGVIEHDSFVGLRERCWRQLRSRVD